MRYNRRMGAENLGEPKVLVRLSAGDDSPSLSSVIGKDGPKASVLRMEFPDSRLGRREVSEKGGGEWQKTMP